MMKPRKSLDPYDPRVTSLLVAVMLTLWAWGVCEMVMAWVAK